MNDLYSKIEKIVRQAGNMLLSVDLKESEIFCKEGPGNFVTVYDKQIQQFLISELLKILPESSFYGEEETDGNVCRDVNAGYVFFIDPIDGTTNFLFDYRHSCISVALAENGKLLAGFVYNPYEDRMYKGIRGQGAYLNDRCISIGNKGLSEGIAEFGCARYNDDRADLTMKVVKELYLRSICIRNGGSAAIGISKVGSGSNVLYFETMLQPYDYAAASVIVEEAGGKICQMDGTDITIDHGCSIVAGTFAAVTEVIQFTASNNVHYPPM